MITTTPAISHSSLNQGNGTTVPKCITLGPFRVRICCRLTQPAPADAMKLFPVANRLHIAAARGRSAGSGIHTESLQVAHHARLFPILQPPFGLSGSYPEVINYSWSCL